MPNPNEKTVTDNSFSEIPRGSTMDTFDDHLSKLDGTDPADNLDLIHKGSKDDGLPTAKELNPEVADLAADPLADPKTDDDEDEVEVKDEKKAPEKIEEAEDGEYTEADRLKELGYDAPSIEAFVESQKRAQEEAVEGIRQEFKELGIPLYGRTLEEMKVELANVRASLPPPDQQAQGQQQTLIQNQTAAADDISQTVDGILEQYQVDDPGQARFYKQFAGAVAAPLQNQVKQLTARLQQVNNMAAVQDFVTDRMLYEQAVTSKKGDGPVPSFGEIRRMMEADRRANPAAWAQAMYRMTTFGNDNDNPFLGKIDQWRVSKTPTGQTNAEIASKRAAAKVAKFKRQTASGQAHDRTKPAKSNIAADIAATRALKIEDVWPNG